MHVAAELLREVFDLTDPSRNRLFSLTLAEARARVASGDAEAVGSIEGHFAIVAREGECVRMARSLQVPLRYFIVKRHDGPALVVADRIDTIREWLVERGFDDQFRPSYTRMVPAHHVTELRLVGCPDPLPTHERFFAPVRESLPADVDAIGRAYIGSLRRGIDQYLDSVPDDAPLGVCFSGGIDSGSVFLMTYDALLRRGASPGRLKAFTLSVDSGGADLAQARAFLESTDLGLFLEPIEVAADRLDVERTVRVVEDYKPLDVQSAAMALALFEGIRARHPEWTLLLDGDGGDENLKAYPIESNPELTIRSVLNNLMLYQEGWGVDSIKHSLTYSGGLSRGCTRGYAPAARHGFDCFSPYMLAGVVQVAESVPFIELTAWDHDRLYELKGRVVSWTGLRMPVFPKRRFQHGAGPDASRLPDDPAVYRRAFHAVFGP